MFYIILFSNAVFVFKNMTKLYALLVLLVTLLVATITTVNVPYYIVTLGCLIKAKYFVSLPDTQLQCC